MFWEPADMAGPKGVVNLLQQFLKTGASSGTLDAALGACKVRTERFFLQKYAIWWWFLHQKMSELFVKGTIDQGICCPNWNNNFDMNIININIEIILNINMYRAISAFLSFYVWQPEIHYFIERDRVRVTRLQREPMMTIDCCYISWGWIFLINYIFLIIGREWKSWDMCIEHDGRQTSHQLVSLVLS